MPAPTAYDGLSTFRLDAASAWAGRMNNGSLIHRRSINSTVGVTQAPLIV